MTLLDSIYINNSGGRVLLDYLVKQLHLHEADCFYLFDKRCGNGFDYVPPYQREYLSNAISARLAFYRKLGNAFDKIICFSNVPPPIRSKAIVYTFFQNVLLCEADSLLPWKARKLTELKQYFIEKNLRHTEYFIVQTEHVKECFLRRYKFDKDKILVLPFYEEKKPEIDLIKKDMNKFLYVSDGNPHKNHSRLLEAWEEINQVNPSLQLNLTVSNRYPELVEKVNEYIFRGVNITNHGILSKNELDAEYKNSYYLIYPSSTESFGLGIVEGLQNNCEVIAADKPYVHAVCDPFAVFDEKNSSEIATIVLELADRESAVIGKLHSRLTIKNKLQDWLSLFSPCAELQD